MEGDDAEDAVMTKGRAGGAGGKGKGGKGSVEEAAAKEDEWDDAEEMIPSMVDLQAMKVPGLKDLCGRHGLKKTGKKDELVQRLNDKAREQGRADGADAGGQVRVLLGVLLRC